MISVYEINPLTDHRWEDFLENHPAATVFHSPEWLTALHQTYGYAVSAFTTTAPEDPLTNALVFCRVQSWLTGRRLVSVPFSDHCTPLFEGKEQLEHLWSRLKKECDHRERYLEVRTTDPSEEVTGMASKHSTFCLHRLNLYPSLTKLFDAFHDSCVRRKIARAQREGLAYEEGTSEELLQKFYRLNILTRRRHQIPPQPLAWFQNLIGCVGEKLKIRLVSHHGQPAAGILTIRHKSTMTYKYGCSDPRFHRYGTMQLLMWRAIQDAKADGLLHFDMGRTEWNNQGLLHFKDRWGTTRSTLTYLRYPAQKIRESADCTPGRFARFVLPLAPDRLLTTAGKVLYRHIG